MTLVLILRKSLSSH